MYIADRFIEKELQRWDPLLSVRWIHKDPVGRLKDRWGIFRKVPGPGKNYYRDWLIKYVQNGDGSFRPLDIRTVREIKAADTHVRGARSIVDDYIAEQEKGERQADEAWTSEMKDVIKDSAADLAKTADDQYPDHGAVNVPKEDLQPEMDEETADTWT